MPASIRSRIDTPGLRTLSGLVVVLGLSTLASDIAVERGIVIGNASPSVPRGLYTRAEPEVATYVTFCLGNGNALSALSSRFCTAGSPDGVRILKRIAGRRPDGRLVVAGDTPLSLDSRFLGPVAPEDIRGWWQPLLLIDPEPDP